MAHTSHESLKVVPQKDDYSKHKVSKFKNFVKQIVYLYIGIIDQIGLCF